MVGLVGRRLWIRSGEALELEALGWDDRMPDRAMVMGPRAVAGAVRLLLFNHLGCESRVVGKPSIGDGFVKCYNWRGSEGSGCVEN